MKYSVKMNLCPRTVPDDRRNAPMKIGLLIPCYVDLFYPEVGVATNKFTAAPDSPERRKISASVYDLVEFLHDVLKLREFPGTEFKHKVALHTSCSAIRGIGLASMSERVHDPKFSKPKELRRTSCARTPDP
jgi:Fe-S oxidoreductase